MKKIFKFINAKTHPFIIAALLFIIYLLFVYVVFVI